MISKVEHCEQHVADKIYDTFQTAYKVEADLIEVKNFPPLSRSIEDIKNAETFFYCISKDNLMAAVIEVSLKDRLLDINSLTVHPNFFRQGLGKKILCYVLVKLNYDSAFVETVVNNLPAIKLYQSIGFNQHRRWT
ncbi:MAG: GNAT family N-acetyltransferase, partial [Colwellia sp.]